MIGIPIKEAYIHQGGKVKSIARTQLKTKIIEKYTVSKFESWSLDFLNQILSKRALMNTYDNAGDADSIIHWIK